MVPSHPESFQAMGPKLTHHWTKQVKCGFDQFDLLLKDFYSLNLNPRFPYLFCPSLSVFYLFTTSTCLSSYLLWSYLLQQAGESLMPRGSGGGKALAFPLVHPAVRHQSFFCGRHCQPYHSISRRETEDRQLSAEVKDWALCPWVIPDVVLANQHLSKSHVWIWGEKSLGVWEPHLLCFN